MGCVTSFYYVSDLYRIFLTHLKMKSHIALRVIALVYLVDVGVYSSIHHQTPFLDNMLFNSKTTYKHSKVWFPEYAAQIGMSSSIVSDTEQTTVHRVRTDITAPSTCTPVQLSLVLRHGIRYPSKGDVKKFAKVFEKIKALDVKDEFLALKDWQNIYHAELASELSEGGSQELFDIAQRYVDVFGDIFKDLIESDNAEVFVSSKRRTVDSAQAFMEGVAQKLGVDYGSLVSGLSKRNDLLRFFANCSRYDYDVSTHHYY